jgi:hypothetical protein
LVLVVLVRLPPLTNGTMVVTLYFQQLHQQVVEVVVNGSILVEIQVVQAVVVVEITATAGAGTG